MYHIEDFALKFGVILKVGGKRCEVLEDRYTFNSPAVHVRFFDVYNDNPLGEKEIPWGEPVELVLDENEINNYEWLHLGNEKNSEDCSSIEIEPIPEG